MTETERTALLQACAFASVFMQSADAELRGASPQTPAPIRSPATRSRRQGKPSHSTTTPRRYTCRSSGSPSTCKTSPMPEAGTTKFKSTPSGSTRKSFCRPSSSLNGASITSCSERKP